MELANNRKANFNYQIIDTLEAGLVLQGTEVKSCRGNGVSMQDSHVSFEGGEAWLRECHIAPYKEGNRENHEPKRKRKLLIHKREMKRLLKQVEQKGLTVVPLKFYLKRGKIKVLLGLAKGKNVADKRDTLKKRDSDRQMQRIKSSFR